MNLIMNDVKMNNEDRKEPNENNRNFNLTNNTNDSKLHEFFGFQLKDIYWADQSLMKMLPKMRDAATNSQLKDAFASQVQKTKEHVQRLEHVFSSTGIEAEAVKCPAMAGIISEGEDIIGRTDKDSAQRDVGLIFASQKALHYKIATYGGLVTLAKTLGFDDAAEQLHQTLTEVKDWDNHLTTIAKKQVNSKANNELVEG